MRGVIAYLLPVLLLFSLSFAAAEACDPSISLLNQDPYPAVPGEYVKIVFQVDGLENPECGDFTFELLDKYPLRFDPWENQEKFFKKIGFLNKDYNSNLLIPYEVRVDEDAVDGSNRIEVRSKVAGLSSVVKTFNLEVQESKVLFEVFVKNYDYATRELTFEILNIGDSDIEALAIEIPQQESVQIKGPNRVVVGDLDSNEFTTADFEALVEDGSIDVELVYSDSINVRRRVGNSVGFDSSYFTNRVGDQQERGAGTYLLWIVIALIVIWFVRKKFFTKKKR